MAHLTGRAASYAGVRSIMESPIMDDRKWAKVPSIPADCFMLDLEDSVPPALKIAARDKVVAHVGRDDFFGDAVVMARPNHLSTPWGRDDLEALASAKAPLLACPKISTPQEIDDVLEITRRLGSDPDIFAIIETARSIEHVAAIAEHPNVVGLMFGPGDLSVDSGITLFDGHGDLNPAFLFPRVRTTLAASAAGKLSATIAFAADLKDLDEIRRRYTEAAQTGFTAGITFYPPHVGIVNDVFGPDPIEVARARTIVTAYEAGLANGDAATTLDDGTVLLVHDYEKALALAVRADAVGA